MPTYRVLRQDSDGDWKIVGGLSWGQDESNVVEDLIAGWNGEDTAPLAEPRKSKGEEKRTASRL